MNFKFFNGIGDESYLSIGTIYQFQNNLNAHERNEFCFQFDDDEPFVFATGNRDLILTMSPTNNSNITFTREGRRFTLFAREVQV